MIPVNRDLRISRRDLLELIGLPLACSAQMATRNVTPTARAKSSGLPFSSHLTDVALDAGLTSPIIYGDLGRNAYILESIGCGIAFIDYDNDGWLDIFVLSGTSAAAAPVELGMYIRRL